MVVDAASGDFTGWAQVGTLIGGIIGGVFLLMKGRTGEASTAITQTRAEATEVFVKETQQNRDALLALRELLASEREIMLAMKDAVTRLVLIQEDIARLMHEQRESEKMLAQEARLLEQLQKREHSREREEDRAETRRGHRD